MGDAQFTISLREEYERKSHFLTGKRNESFGPTVIFELLQVHLEIDPTEYQDDENKYAALKDSNQARLEIMKDILSKHLDMDCSNVVNDTTYTTAYFLGRHDVRFLL